MTGQGPQIPVARRQWLTAVNFNLLNNRDFFRHSVTPVTAAGMACAYRHGQIDAQAGRITRRIGDHAMTISLQKTVFTAGRVGQALAPVRSR